MDVPYSVTVGADGRAAVRIWSGNVEIWRVSQVSVRMANAPAGAVCELRKNGAFVTLLVATGDVAGGDPPVTVAPGDQLTVQWSGCTPDDTGEVFVIYDVIDPAEYQR